MESIISNTFVLSSISPRALKVYNFLIEKANRKTRSSFWRKSKIALACSMSESTFARAIRELKAAHLVAVQERYETCGRQKSNEYFLLEEHPNVSMPSITFTKALHGNNLKVYLYINRRCGNIAYRIAMRDIAGGCGIARKTAQKCISYLKAHRYINVTAQNRLELFGDAGAGYNLYTICGSPDDPIHSKKTFCFQRILCALLSSILTPSPTSTVTPLITFSKLKITNKKKIEDISLEKTPCLQIITEAVRNSPTKFSQPAWHSPPHNSMRLKSMNNISVLLASILLLHGLFFLICFSLVFTLQHI